MKNYRGILQMDGDAVFKKFYETGIHTEDRSCGF